MYISAKFSNWHFKRNILGKMIVLGNRCINLCPEKCILSEIPIACQEMCSEQLKCFPISSSTMSLGQLKSKLLPNPAHFGKNYFFIKSPMCHCLFYIPPLGLSEKVYTTFQDKYQNYKCFSQKKGLWTDFYMVHEA